MKNQNSFKNKDILSGGFTIIEVVIGIGILIILLVGVLGAYNSLTRSTLGARQQAIITSLAAQNSEIIRNMSYSSVGTINGNPNGVLSDYSNPTNVTIEGTVYSTYYEVAYIDDPADGTILAGTDPAPNDYKQIKMFVKNNSTNVITPFITNVAPAGLEGLNNAGALVINVLDSNGQAVANANIHIQSVGISPAIILDRQSDLTGNWVEVGLPAGANAYNITVTKNGYSTDKTYPITLGNPNPTKPDSTVVNGQITQISFAIDTLGNLTIKTLNQTCQAINGINLNVAGSKIIGSTPTVLKYSNNFTSSSGQVALNNIEWDTYTPTLLTGQSYMVYGSSPIQQITVLPSASQTFSLILGPVSTNSLLVIVKDSATKTALEGASVRLTNSSPSYDQSKVTGGSIWQQTDWTGGLGQDNFTDSTKYKTQDTNITTTGVPNALRLQQLSGNYVASGWLESSSFDTGASSNYTTISWSPASQVAGAVVKFQLASNNDNTTWSYKGPDGTSGSYYTIAGSNIAAVHDGDRYIRYKVYLSTSDTTKTPVLTSMVINYVSGCFTPGQVMFPSLTANNNYSVNISLPGYQDKTVNNLNISGNQTLEVLLSQ